MWGWWLLPSRWVRGFGRSAEWTRPRPRSIVGARRVLVCDPMAVIAYWSGADGARGGGYDDHRVARVAATVGSDPGVSTVRPDHVGLVGIVIACGGTGAWVAGVDALWNQMRA